MYMRTCGKKLLVHPTILKGSITDHRGSQSHSSLVYSTDVNTVSCPYFELSQLGVGLVVTVNIRHPSTILRIIIRNHISDNFSSCWSFCELLPLNTQTTRSGAQNANTRYCLCNLNYEYEKKSQINKVTNKLLMQLEWKKCYLFPS